MKTIFIAKLNEDEAKVVEAVSLNDSHVGRRMVRNIEDGLIYYEKVANIAETKEGAIEILKNRTSNLVNQVKELWNSK